MSDFIQKCINGDALLEEVNDFIDSWHESDVDTPLHTFLGMSEQEYRLFVQDENYLAWIVAAQREEKPVHVFVKQNLSMAARSDDSSKSELLQKWLKAEGLWD